MKNTGRCFRKSGCRGAGILILALVATHLKADTILLTDYNDGSGSITTPAYYVTVGNSSCGQSAGSDGYQTVTCSGVTMSTGDGYFSSQGLTDTTDTIPATIYVGDLAGNVSDEITTTLGRPGSCSPQPSCQADFVFINLSYSFGMDLTGSPITCASVGGCNVTYNNSVQNLGVITWSDSSVSPETLEFQGSSAPEPASLVLFGLGGLLLVSIKKRSNLMAR